MIHHLVSMWLRCCLDVTTIRLLHFTFEKSILRMVHMLVGFIRCCRNNGCLDEILWLWWSNDFLLIYLIKIKTFTNCILGSTRIDEPPLLRRCHSNRLRLYNEYVLLMLISNDKLILINTHVLVSLRHKPLSITTSCSSNISIILLLMNIICGFGRIWILRSGSIVRRNCPIIYLNQLSWVSIWTRLEKEVVL